jgi:hypothetical protein
MKEFPKSQAEQFIKEKQSVEVGLAFDVLEEFDQNPHLLEPVRAMCRASIVLVDEMVRKKTVLEGFIFSANFRSKWKLQYKCFNGVEGVGWNADALLRRSNTWSASNCGDWIRVYGEMVEEKYFGPTEDALRTSYQVGPEGTWKKATRVDPGQTLSQPNFLRDNLRRRVEFRNLSLAEQGIYTSKLTNSHKLLTEMESSGIKRWAIMEGDTTGKMDDVFGLAPGATISGTTTDNIYFMQKFALKVSDPALFLLPYGTIGAGGHHSLLEVALPLSMNGVIDYRIGCYSTLIPEGFTSPDAQLIRTFLRKWEDRPENRLMLVYYEGGRVDGCFVFDSAPEKLKWKAKLTANRDLLSRFNRLPNNPSRYQAQTFAVELGFELPNRTRI